MIYLASDIHGHIRLEWLRKELDKFSLSAADYLIILGDAGMIWSKTEHLEVCEYYERLRRIDGSGAGPVPAQFAQRDFRQVLGALSPHFLPDGADRARADRAVFAR